MSLRGFSTLIFLVDDVAAATDWYTELLGAAPVFTRPGPGGRIQYAKFAIGDQAELALADRAKAPLNTVEGPGGAIMHWRVDDVEATLARVESMGVKQHTPITPHGPFVTAVVVDPFGNLLGLQGVLAVPHYVDDLVDATAT